MKSSLNLLCIAARFYGPLQDYAAQFGGCGWCVPLPRSDCRLITGITTRSLCTATQELHFFALHTDYGHSIFIMPHQTRAATNSPPSGLECLSPTLNRQPKSRPDGLVSFLWQDSVAMNGGGGVGSGCWCRRLVMRAGRGAFASQSGW